MMTYDLHGSWDNAVGHSSALYPSASDTGDKRFLNVVCHCEHMVIWVNILAHASVFFFHPVSLEEFFMLLCFL